MIDDHHKTKLTISQQRFCHEYVLGPHAGNATRSYARAFGRDDQNPDGTCKTNGHKLLKREEVRAEVDRLTKHLMEVENLTPQTYMAQIASLVHECKAAGNYGAAMRGLELIGKVCGHYVERHEFTKTDKTEVQIKAEIRHMVSANPSLMKLVVEQHPELACEYANSQGLKLIESEATTVENLPA